MTSQWVISRAGRILEGAVRRCTEVRGSAPWTGSLIPTEEAKALAVKILAGTEASPGGVVVAADPMPPEFARAAECFGLSPFELDVLVLALAPEVDARLARIVAYVNDHALQTRPTVGLAVEALLGDAPGDRWMWSFAPDAPLAHYGLIELETREPLSRRPIRPAADFWPRLIGGRAAVPGIELVSSGLLDELVVPDPLRDQARRCARWLATTPRSRLVVHGPEGSGRRALALAIAREAGHPAIVVGAAMVGAEDSLARVRREAAWHDAVVVVAADGAASIATDLRAPVIWIGAPPISGDETTLLIQPAAPDVAARCILWRRCLGEAGGARVDPDVLAERFRFGPGRIRSVVETTRTHTRVALGRAPTTDDLLHACRSSNDAVIGELAQKLPTSYGWNDLVVPRETRRELDLAVAWARHRPRVMDSWEAGRKLAGAGGLTCLFCGPPGTGKTMAAQVLAREMAVDIYRVDLSQVVSKYIGETEKHLSRLFNEVRTADAVLFFDEADALFGKRTSVQDAHDRYANIETAYLLQRMELHEGVTILATNLRQNLDGAFLRRLQIVADFLPPDGPERERIWSNLLPPDRSPSLDISLLAARFAVTGGEIRNAVLAAVFLAAADAEPLAMRHVAVGVWRELRKSGRMIDPSMFGPWSHDVLGQA